MNAEVLLTDSFEGSTLDSAKWEALFPFSDSSISVQEGYLSSLNRGIILSKAQFVNPITVSGNFNLKYSHSLFQIILRSDGQYTSDLPYGVVNGVTVGFMNGVVWVDEYGISNVGHLWDDYRNIGLDVFQSFSISDNGFEISVSLNGNQLFSVSTSFSPGSKVAFFGRENVYGPDRTDIGQIEIVPEPSSLSLLLVGGVVLMAGRRSNK